MFEARIPTRQFGSFDSTAMLAEKRRQHHTAPADIREDVEKGNASVHEKAEIAYQA